MSSFLPRWVYFCPGSTPKPCSLHCSHKPFSYVCMQHASHPPQNTPFQKKAPYKKNTHPPPQHLGWAPGLAPGSLLPAGVGFSVGKCAKSSIHPPAELQRESRSVNAAAVLRHSSCRVNVTMLRKICCCVSGMNMAAWMWHHKCCSKRVAAPMLQREHSGVNAATWDLWRERHGTNVASWDLRRKCCFVKAA